LKLFVHNDTKQVGINTAQLFSENPLIILPSPIPSQYDLYVNGTLAIGSFDIPSPLLASTLAGVNILTSSLITPTFGLNPTNPSTLNTLSTSFAENPYNSKITVNNFVDLIKSGSTLQGYMQIKKPYDGIFDNQYYFSVYNDAFISSVTIPELRAETLYVQSQLL
jgi:hypothetical protein